MSDITKQQKAKIKARLSRQGSPFKKHEFFTIISSKDELVVLCKYETGIGLVVFDRIFPDGTSNHGGSWPAVPSSETSREMAKILNKNLKNKFGKNLPIVLDIAH